MAELKTKKTKASVSAFLAGFDPAVRKDCRTLVGLMEKATKSKARMWGTAIVGFGDYHYRSERTGREGDWFVMGFAPRRGTLTLYLMSGLRKHAALLARLGRHKISGSCLHIKKLEDVDAGVLKKLVSAAARL